MKRTTRYVLTGTAALTVCLLHTIRLEAQCVHDTGAQSLFTFVAPFSPLPLLDRPDSGVACLNAILLMAAGGAVGDFDNDGDQDIFFLSGGVEPDRLYINNGSGHFTDSAPAWGVDMTHIGIGVAVGDVNNDGWLDVFVTSLMLTVPPETTPDHKLYINTDDGSGSRMFVDRAEDWLIGGTDPEAVIIPFGWSPAFGDYDGDGDLDLAVAQRIPAKCLGECDFAGPLRPMTLLENTGSTFVDRTDRLPHTNCCDPVDNRPVGFAPRFVDMDGSTDDDLDPNLSRDRLPDLLMTIDFANPRFMVNPGLNDPSKDYLQATGPCDTGAMPPVYTHNQSCPGSPADSPIVAGLDTRGNAMGQAVADFNRDAHLDWVYSAKEGENLVAWTQINPAMGCGNEPLPLAEYADKGCEWLLKDGVWSWGVTAFDADQDGDTDIAVATLGERSENRGRDALFLNRLSESGGTTFDRFVFTHDTRFPAPGLGILDFDADNDGDRDVLIFHGNPCIQSIPGVPLTTVTLWKNRTVESGGNVNWFRLFIDTCGLASQRLAPNGIGTRVEVIVDLDGPGGQDPPVTLVD